MQRKLNGEKLYPVICYSRKTTKDKAKYRSYELEALAIMSALERFRLYLIGIHFVMKTDCFSLNLSADKQDLNLQVVYEVCRISVHKRIDKRQTECRSERIK